MEKGTAALVVTVLLGSASRLAAADACTIDHTSVVRGTRITVTVAGAAPLAKGTLEFTPASPYDGTSADKRTTPIALTNGSTDYTVSDLLLGRYAVAFLQEDHPVVNCGSLAVTLPPQWSLSLKPFQPDGTDRAERVTIGDKDVGTVALTLLGAGFITDVPEDNRVFVNGKRVPIIRAGCAGGHPTDAIVAPQDTVSNTGRPSMDTSRAEVVGSDRIELCGVQVTRNGDVLRVSVALGDRFNGAAGVSVWGAPAVVDGCGRGRVGWRGDHPRIGRPRSHRDAEAQQRGLKRVQRPQDSLSGSGDGYLQSLQVSVLLLDGGGSVRLRLSRDRADARAEPGLARHARHLAGDYRRQRRHGDRRSVGDERAGAKRRRRRQREPG